MDTPTAAIAEHLAALNDPRRAHRKLYPLEEILLLRICAVICGADSFVAIEQFGRAKAALLRRFLPFKNGIPSHDTIGDLLARIDPMQFERRFADWVGAVFALTRGQVIPIDGKRLRCSYDRHTGRAALEMVSAWARSVRPSVQCPSNGSRKPVSAEASSKRSADSGRRPWWASAWAGEPPKLAAEAGTQGVTTKALAGRTIPGFRVMHMLCRVLHFRALSCRIDGAVAEAENALESAQKGHSRAFS